MPVLGDLLASVGIKTANDTAEAGPLPQCQFFNESSSTRWLFVEELLEPLGALLPSPDSVKHSVCEPAEAKPSKEKIPLLLAEWSLDLSRLSKDTEVSLPIEDGPRSPKQDDTLTSSQVQVQSVQGALPLLGLRLFSPFLDGPLAGVPLHRVSSFLLVVQASYKNMPYHNSLHGAEVGLLGHWLCRETGAFANMSPLVQLAFVTAALCHDVGHPGENNNFQKTSRSSLAVIYNDKAVLENFHAAETFRILASEQCNFSEAMSPQDFGVFREHVVDLILATDMAVHMEFLSKFKVRLESDDFLQGPELEGDGKGAAEVEKQLKIDTGLLAQACIKAADIGHSAKPWDVHYKYSLSVVEEFFKQGDKEREMGLPISALCDRNAASSLAQSQRGFLLFLCRPMFVVLASAEKVWRERLLDAAIDARRRESQKRRGSTSPKSPKYVKRRSSFDVDLASIGHSSRHLSIVSGLGGNAQVSVVENVCLGLLDKNVEEWTKRMTPPQEKGKK